MRLILLNVQKLHSPKGQYGINCASPISEMSPRPNPILKVILLGDSGVGKSSIINRYVNDRFVENNMQTIGVDLFTKVATVGESCVTLQIWDTGGQERFRALRTPFYRGADCAILVYGKDNPKTRKPKSASL